MIKYKTIFFDLDGTLFDTSKGIYATFDYVFSLFGKKVNKEIYPTFIGPPVRQSLATVLNDSVLDVAHKEFREYYGKDAKFDARLYNGIEKTLAFFKEIGCKIYTATSKSQIMSKELIVKFGISKYFDDIFGADVAIRRVNKSDVLKYALSITGDVPKDCLLIGDTYYDVKGAEDVGMDCLVVKYGFGEIEDMQAKNVIGYADTPEDIVTMFLRNIKKREVVL